MWIDFDKWQEILNSIKRHKLRTVLTAFGVFWGIFMLVILLGSISGLQNSFIHDFRDDAVNSLWLYANNTTKTYKGLKKGRRIEFNNEDYEFLKEQFSEIEDLSGRFYLSSTLLTKYKNKKYSYRIRSVHPGHKVIENTIIKEGRYINENDIDKTQKVAVIGKFVEDELFEQESALAKEINIGGILYKVVGVFTDSGGENEMKQIYIPITTAQKVYSGGDRIHQLMINGGNLSLEEMKSLENRVRNVFAIRKQFDPTDRRAIWINNRAEDFAQFESLFITFGYITWIVGVFSILAGVIGVSNIMLIIVKDRTKEIGIRKALGATPNSIIKMIIQESILITGFAGYSGMFVGMGIIFLIRNVESDFFRHPTVDINVIILATIILVISGALAGLLPALKAAGINPVEAIKKD